MENHYSPRIVTKDMTKWFFSGKAIFLVGARQTGKTTLIKHLLSENRLEKNCKTILGDDMFDRTLLENKGLAELKNIFEKTNVIFIDEAHKIKDIGNSLKLLVDYYKTKKQIIVTASSSIHLLDKTAETLTGRKIVFQLFPFALEEIDDTKSCALWQREIENLLLYGTYPEVFLRQGYDEKQILLKEIAGSTMYKDMLEFQLIKNSSIMQKLIKALALQIGQEVSFNELHNLIGLDPSTIEKYVDLLEKNFIIFRLSPFAKNKRRQISRLRKIYFWDTGIRNALIENFNPLDSRADVGHLWENFLIAERLKFKNNHRLAFPSYFWRTYDGAEVDFVEENNEKISGFEFKFNDKKKVKPPQAWRETDASFMPVSRNNFLEFVKNR